MQILEGRPPEAIGRTKIRIRAPYMRLVAAGMIGALVLSGCSLYNPHVRPSEADRDAGLIDPDAKFQGTLPKAIKYANLQRDLYYNAVGDQSRLRSSLALTLAPLTAAALYLGITSSSGLSRDVITGLGIGGATAFGLGTFFESKTRQKVYLEGSRVIGCAIIAMGPVLMTEDDYEILKHNLDGIGAATAKVDQRIGTLEIMIADPAALTEKWNAELTGFMSAANAQIDALKNERNRLRVHRDGLIEDLERAKEDLKQAKADLERLQKNQSDSNQLQTTPLPTVDPVPLMENAVLPPVPAAPSPMTLSLDQATALAAIIEQLKARIENLVIEKDGAETALREITNALNNFQNALGRQVAQLDGSAANSSPELQQQRIKEAKAEIAAAKQLKATAKTASGDGALLRDRIDKGGLTLTTTVENIRDQVSLELIKTEPDLASITSITDNLGSLASKFAGTELIVPAPAIDPPSDRESLESSSALLEIQAPLPKTLLQRLDDAIQNLRNAERELATFANAVTQLVDRATEASQNAGAITSCQVQAVASDFAVAPDVEEISLTRPDGAYQFVISGSGIPRAAFVGLDATGMKAISTVEGGSHVVKISMDPDAGPEPDTYTLRISNSSDSAFKIIGVKVLPIPTEPSPPDTGEEEILIPSDLSLLLPAEQPIPVVGGESLPIPGSSALYSGSTDYQIRLDEFGIKNLQEKLGLTPDGVIGPKTISAIKGYQKGRGRRATGHLTMQDVEELFGIR